MKSHWQPKEPRQSRQRSASPYFTTPSTPSSGSRRRKSDDSISTLADKRQKTSDDAASDPHGQTDWELALALQAQYEEEYYNVGSYSPLASPDAQASPSTSNGSRRRKSEDNPESPPAEKRQRLGAEDGATQDVTTPGEAPEVSQPMQSSPVLTPGMGRTMPIRTAPLSPPPTEPVRGRRRLPSGSRSLVESLRRIAPLPAMVEKTLSLLNKLDPEEWEKPKLVTAGKRPQRDPEQDHQDTIQKNGPVQELPTGTHIAEPGAPANSDKTGLQRILVRKPAADDDVCPTPWRHVSEDEVKIQLMKYAHPYLLLPSERALGEGCYAEWEEANGSIVEPLPCLTPWRHVESEQDRVGMMRCADPALLSHNERALLEEWDAQRVVRQRPRSGRQPAPVHRSPPPDTLDTNPAQEPGYFWWPRKTKRARSGPELDNSPFRPSRRGDIKPPPIDLSLSPPTPRHRPWEWNPEHVALDIPPYERRAKLRDDTPAPERSPTPVPAFKRINQPSIPSSGHMFPPRPGGASKDIPPTSLPSQAVIHQPTPLSLPAHISNTPISSPPTTPKSTPTTPPAAHPPSPSPNRPTTSAPPAATGKE